MDVKKDFKLFGGTVEIVLYDVEASFSELFFEEIYVEAIRLQKIFNFYDTNSELSRLNRLRKLTVSSELLNVITEALTYCELTNGAYDITKGKDILLRKQGLDIIYSVCSYKDISISGSVVTLTHKDVLIDLGSIAKGYIVDRLIEFIQDQGIQGGFIDARGDMRFFGDAHETIEIQHPRNDETLNSLVLKNNSIATSGDYNQYYGDYATSHIVGKKEFISVTVIADSLMKADVLATCISLCNKDEVLALVRNSTDVKVMCMDSNLQEFEFESTAMGNILEVQYAI